MKTLVSRVAFVALFSSVIGYPAYGLEPLRTVALSEHYPFVPPVINNHGQTAFSTSPPKYQPDPAFQPGVYAETQVGTLELVAGYNQQIPGASEGTKLSVAIGVLLNTNGDIAYLGSFGGTESGEAIFGRMAGESIRWIARTWQKVSLPGSPGETGDIIFPMYDLPSLGSDGRVNVPVTVFVPYSRDRMLREMPTGSLELLDDSFTVATTKHLSPEEVMLDVIAWDIHHINTNENGGSVYLADLQATANHGTNFLAGTTAIVQTTATGENQVIRLLQGSYHPRDYTSPVAINATGDFAFMIHQLGNELPGGIYRATSDGVSPVALSGDPVPAAEDGSTFQRFGGNVWYNDRGETLFLASLSRSSTTPADARGIFVDRPDRGISLVARSDDPAPGTEEGVTFGRIQDFNSTLNNAGQVAFSAFLNNTDSTSDFGIWAQDRQGQLHLIAREGDELDVSAPGEPADLRTILSLDFHELAGSGPAYGTGFNDRGQLAFSARFTDGSYGVFVSNAVAVPEPMSVVTVIGGMLIMAAYRFTRQHGS